MTTSDEPIIEVKHLSKRYRIGMDTGVQDLLRNCRDHAEIARKGAQEVAAANGYLLGVEGHHFRGAARRGRGAATARARRRS